MIHAIGNAKRPFIKLRIGNNNAPIINLIGSVNNPAMIGRIIFNSKGNLLSAFNTAMIGNKNKNANNPINIGKPKIKIGIKMPLRMSPKILNGNLIKLVIKTIQNSALLMKFRSGNPNQIGAVKNAITSGIIFLINLPTVVKKPIGNKNKNANNPPRVGMSLNSTGAITNTFINNFPRNIGIPTRNPSIGIKIALIKLLNAFAIK